jgi:hypothetical protein
VELQNRSIPPPSWNCKIDRFPHHRGIAKLIDSPTIVELQNRSIPPPSWNCKIDRFPHHRGIAKSIDSPTIVQTFRRNVSSEIYFWIFVEYIFGFSWNIFMKLRYCAIASLLWLWAAILYDPLAFESPSISAQPTVQMATESDHPCQTQLITF